MGNALNPSVGTIIIGIGIVLIVAGYFLIRKQHHEKQLSQERILNQLKAQVKEAKLVSNELNTLMRKTTTTSAALIDQIQSNLAEAKQVSAQLENVKQRAQTYGNMKNHVEPHKTDNFVQEKSASILQPFHVKEYVRQSKLTSMSGTQKINKTPISTMSRVEEYLREIDPREPKAWHKEKRYAQVHPLLQMGVGITEVALLLNLGIGEVQLVSKLQKAN